MTETFIAMLSNVKSGQFGDFFPPSFYKLVLVCRVQLFTAGFQPLLHLPEYGINQNKAHDVLK